jgi:tripartite-type tricarboxylate transporter receptor subunit TctC
MLGTEQVAGRAGRLFDLYCKGTIAANLALYKNIRYDTLKDFGFVRHQFVHSDGGQCRLALQDLGDVLEFASTNRASSARIGRRSTGTRRTAAAAIKMTHVPYKGSAPGLTDLVGARIDTMFDYPVAILPHIQSGRLRPLAVMGNKRLAVMPDVPTIAELGFPEAAASPWSGVCVPAGTSPEVIRKLSNAMRDALADPAVVGQFEKLATRR